MIQAGVAYISPDPKIGSKPSPTDVPVLTPKQGRILRCLGRGLTIRTIVLDLGLSIRTIESHKSTIMQELSVHGTRDLVVRAKHLGLLS
ncbi:TPA: response regulator transcription factor [Stenotrophomonas maltophilia]|nr:response regulator transcription factor [Stenotrophomonas maltophilia]